ncbi:MFS transporter [Streptomyces sp. WI04-05B]|uniref:MFS transporter n=1 Tax=Streptomyces TaxID=1883 RepID=UPI0029BB27CE|nr:MULTISPECIES: MFS transporter [unclassified Streptomyces]MDX2548993.1 MFS transporter [Streptomyces sp. WI04-05B]MDX2590593.1 MFS transporter [Streptomyces sp. WI04-05A]MDX3746215.1 MFS transporter [Streptomyces sp. AK08-02]
MLLITLVDRIGSGLWASVSVLYFTYVSGLSVAEVGVLVAAAGAIGIAGAPMGGRLADRFPLTRVLVAVQLMRALASFALLTTDHYVVLLACTAVGGFGDRASSVITKLYATRVAGPDRVRYQAVNRTAANAGWALGGLAAAAALALGSTAAYRWLLIGDALSFVVIAILTVRCAEPPSPSRTVITSSDPTPTDRPSNPWRDRTYLAYVATETVLFLDDAVFKVGLPLWIAHTGSAPAGLAPLLMVLNNVMVVALQVPLARLGATTKAARALLLPLSAVFALSGITMALSATGTATSASLFLAVSAAAFTLAEMLHATVSWELSVALASDAAQGAYLGVHGLAQAVQRSIGPLAVTAAITAGPLGWTTFGVGIAVTCMIQHRVVRDRLTQKALSVPPITVSEH